LYNPILGATPQYERLLFIYLFTYLFSFDEFVYMTQEMGELVAASRPVVSLLRLYALRLIGFRAVLLLLQQNLSGCDMN
jgi:hypothetical protein